MSGNGQVISLDQIEEITNKQPVIKRVHKTTYKTERGIEIKYHAVNMEMIRTAWTSIPVPKVPMVFIPDRGREEPHPHDPGYQAEISQYNNKVQSCIHKMYLMRGCEIKEIPDSIPQPESDDWFEGMEEFMEIPKGKLARQTLWLFNFISDKELNEIVEDLMIMSGLITEEVVEEAVKSFRDNSVQETSDGLSSN